MKTLYKLLTVLAIPSILLLYSYSGGSPGSRTNSPLDGENCTLCHSDSDAESVDFWISSNIPFQGYTPGETYTITATGSHENVVKFGFEITAESDSDKVGAFALTDEERTQFTNDNSAVTHTSDGNTPDGDVNSWQMDWTAPEEGVGEITFYAAFNAANGNGTTSGDQIYTSTLLVNQFGVGVGENALSEKVTLYPNPATSYVNMNVPDHSSIQVMNSMGQKVFELDDVSNTAKLDVSNYDNGIYFVRVNHEGLSTTKRILKTN